MMDELRALWNDRAYFRARVRGAVAFLGAMMAAGYIPSPEFAGGWKVGLIVMAASTAINAGQQNREPKAPATK